MLIYGLVAKNCQFSSRLTARHAKNDSANQSCARDCPVLALTYLIIFGLGLSNAQKLASFLPTRPLALFERNCDVVAGDFGDFVVSEISVLIKSVGFGFGFHEVDEAGWDVAGK